VSVVSNASPLNYLILIGHAEILPVLYQTVVISSGVLRELQASRTPEAVRSWVLQRPPWLEVQTMAAVPEQALSYLGIGESETIELVQRLGLAAVLMDDRDGRNEAERRQIKVIGTLGVIADAADLGLLDLEEAIRRLQQTSFRAAPRLIKAILDRNR
jgi:predicted nucleic acid-binding protein